MVNYFGAVRTAAKAPVNKKPNPPTGVGVDRGNFSLRVRIHVEVHVQRPASNLTKHS